MIICFRRIGIKGPFCFFSIIFLSLPAFLFGFESDEYTYEKYYSFFTFPSGRTIFLSEWVLTSLLLILIGIIVLFFLIYSGRRNALLVFHLRLFFKTFWVFLLLPVFMLVSIKACALLYFQLLSFFNRPYILVNNTGVGLTLLMAALVFSLPYPALDLLRFPRRARFYGFSAVFFSFSGLIFAAFFDFSFVPVFLWAFVFVFLGAAAPNPFLVFLCVVVTPIFAFGALLNIIDTNNSRLLELIILRGWNTQATWTALQITLLALPLFLLLRRGVVLMKKNYGRQFKRKTMKSFFVIPVLILTVLALMIYQIHKMPHQLNTRLIPSADERISKTEKEPKTLLPLACNSLPGFKALP